MLWCQATVSSRAYVLLLTTPRLAIWYPLRACPGRNDEGDHSKTAGLAVWYAVLGESRTE